MSAVDSIEWVNASALSATKRQIYVRICIQHKSKPKRYDTKNCKRKTNLSSREKSIHTHNHHIKFPVSVSVHRCFFISTFLLWNSSLPISLFIVDSIWLSVFCMHTERAKERKKEKYIHTQRAILLFSTKTVSFEPSKKQQQRKISSTKKGEKWTIYIFYWLKAEKKHIAAELQW